MKVVGTVNSRHDDCNLQYTGNNEKGVLRFYCQSHQQWTYIFPVSITYHYAIETEMPDITIERDK
jgi:hypothetical protein